MNATYLVSSEGVFPRSSMSPDLVVRSLSAEGVSEVETSGGQMWSWQDVKAWKLQIPGSVTHPPSQEPLGSWAAQGWWTRPGWAVGPSTGAQLRVSRKAWRDPGGTDCFVTLPSDSQRQPASGWGFKRVTLRMRRS